MTDLPPYDPNIGWNDGRTIIKSARKLTLEQANEIQCQWLRAYAGPNRHYPIILSPELTIDQTPATRGWDLPPAPIEVVAA